MSTEAIVALVASSVVSFFIALRSLLQWGLTQWKDSQVETRAALDRSTKAMTEVAVLSRDLIAKLDGVVQRLDRIEFRVEELTPPVSEPVPRRNTPRAGVQVGSYSITKPRGSSHGDR